MTRAHRAVPRPLIALLGAVFVVAMTWALLTPPWQSPDETQHFAYTQTLGERFALPGDRSRRPLSREHALGDNASRSGREARIPGVEWNRAAFDRWRRAAGALTAQARRDGPQAVSCHLTVASVGPSTRSALDDLNPGRAVMPAPPVGGGAETSG